MEKVLFLGLMLMIMSKCEPAHNRYKALVTYLACSRLSVSEHDRKSERATGDKQGQRRAGSRRPHSFPTRFFNPPLTESLEQLSFFPTRPHSSPAHFFNPPLTESLEQAMTYLVLQTFLVFCYLSVARFLSQSSSSCLVREDKDKVWQDQEARERLCRVLFRLTIPLTQVLSTTKRLGNTCEDAAGVLKSREN